MCAEPTPLNQFSSRGLLETSEKIYYKQIWLVGLLCNGFNGGFVEINWKEII